MEEQTQQQKIVISSRMADEGDFGNTISLVGNLGRDAEMSYMPDGKAKTKFSAGVWAGKNQTLWVNIVCWEELAEAAVVLMKGFRVKVVGRLRSYKWQGVDRFEVTATWIQILTKKPENESIGSPLSRDEQLEEDKLHETPF
jgi:single-strand DNA-binding protein